jgi:hypothetical protein
MFALFSVALPTCGQSYLNTRAFTGSLVWAITTHLRQVVISPPFTYSTQQLRLDSFGFRCRLSKYLIAASTLWSSDNDKAGILWKDATSLILHRTREKICAKFSVYRNLGREPKGGRLNEKEVKSEY